MNTTTSGVTSKRFHVTGTSHYSAAIERLSFENSDYDLNKKDLIEDGLVGKRVYRMEYNPTSVRLVPEPENPYDSNAVKVVVNGLLIGYIKRGACSQVKNILKKNVLSITCDIHGGPYKVVFESYDDDQDKEVYILERDTAPISATVEIRYSDGPIAARPVPVSPTSERVRTRPSMTKKPKPAPAPAAPRSSLTAADRANPEKALKKYQDCLRSCPVMIAVSVLACVCFWLAGITVGAVICLLLAVLYYAGRGTWQRSVAELQAILDARQKEVDDL